MFAGLVWQEYPDLEIIAKEECIIYSHYTMTMKQYVLLLKLENKPQPTIGYSEVCVARDAPPKIRQDADFYESSILFSIAIDQRWFN